MFFDGDASRGAMLVELMLSMALAMIVIPFIFRYQQNAVRRAENIAVAREMDIVKTALERYIVANRDELLRVVGKNITRVSISDLAQFGVPDGVLDTRGDDYQLRVLKSADFNGQATLQGVVVLNDDDISPVRTREIVNIGGDQMGFVDAGRAYGAFGAWRTSTVDLGLTPGDGIVETTGVTRDNAKYLWRVPSDDAADATMLSPLNLGGHDIVNAAGFNARTGRFDDAVVAGKMVADRAIFENRTALSKPMRATYATVAGILSSDGKNMDVAGNFSLADTAKFTNLNASKLYVTNMTLPGISVSDSSGDVAMLKINQSLDMTSGRIDAMFVTVGFAGSITPRLVVTNRIEDSTNPAYFWDATSRTATLLDVSFAELSRMAPLAVRATRNDGTSSSQIFGAVAANKNATAADFMNAIDEIQHTVRTKYMRLNLE